LTVLYRSQVDLPHEHYLYYADSANVPYGSKSVTEIDELVKASVEKMMAYPLKALVLACNTATSTSVRSLRDMYDIPIIGMEPAVKPAVIQGDPRKTLVLATKLTLTETKYRDLISSLNAEDKVDALPLQELVDYAEEFDFDSPGLKRYLRSSLKSVNWQDYKSVVLGCTHFLYFKNLLKEIIPNHIIYVDGHEGTVRHLASSIQPNPFGTNSDLKCLLSGHEVANEVIGPYLNVLRGQRYRVSTALG